MTPPIPAAGGVTLALSSRSHPASRKDGPIMRGLFVSPAVASVAAIALAVVGQRPASVVTFSDGEFLDTDWTLTVLQNHAAAVARSERVDHGGNPAAYRRIVHDLPPASPALNPQIISLHQRQGADYEPAVQGPIRQICFAEDAYILQGFGQGQSTGPAVWQAGRMYIGPSGITGVPATWQHRAPAALAATDFIEVRAGAERLPGSHPDFTATGAAITVGFYRSNSSRTGGYILDGAIDNWWLQVNCGELAPTATDEPTPTSPPTARPTVTSTPTAPPTAASTATATPTATATVPSSASCICRLVRQRVPPVVIADAMANPGRYYGWRYLLDPGKPESPANPRRECLTLQNEAVDYHPIWNKPHWRVGCR